MRGDGEAPEVTVQRQRRGEVEARIARRRDLDGRRRSAPRSRRNIAAKRGLRAEPDVRAHVRIGSTEIRALTLEALIASKKAARRKKDVEYLIELEAIFVLRKRTNS